MAAPKLRCLVSRILRTIRAARVDGDPSRSSFPVIFPTVSRQIKQSIPVTIDRPAVLTLERSPFCQLDPMCDSDGSNELAHRAGRHFKLLLVGINFQG